MGIFHCFSPFKAVIGPDGMHTESQVGGMRTTFGPHGPKVENVMSGPVGMNTVFGPDGTHLEYNNPDTGMRTVFGPNLHNEWKL